MAESLEGLPSYSQPSRPVPCTTYSRAVSALNIACENPKRLALIICVGTHWPASTRVGCKDGGVGGIIGNGPNLC